MVFHITNKPLPQKTPVSKHSDERSHTVHCILLKHIYCFKQNNYRQQFCVYVAACVCDFFERLLWTCNERQCETSYSQTVSFCFFLGSNGIVGMPSWSCAGDTSLTTVRMWTCFVLLILVFGTY